MSSVPSTSVAASTAFRFDAEWRHHVRLAIAWIAMLGGILSVAYLGFPYYKLSTPDRAYSPLQAVFRPSGTVGLKLGFVGLSLFLILFLYPIRKCWPWLGRIGKTKNWLDFHVLVGISAPIVITLHSSFKLRGLAGLAYWIMMAVALSGFAGRYLYAQIPRSLNAAELSLQEMQALSAQLTGELLQQALLRADEVAPLLKLPDPAAVERMSVLGALWLMFRMDVARPFQVSRIRRRALSGAGWCLTLGGLLPSRHRELEHVISSIRRQSWISAKMLFLKRIEDVFHLWHVVHRPFSYSFAALALMHISVALLLGYY
jgi:hypothetical protein